MGPSCHRLGQIDTANNLVRGIHGNPGILAHAAWRLARGGAGTLQPERGFMLRVGLLDL
jgi:hypothetical protein